MTPSRRTTVSIVIKTFNEERRVAAAIRSALAAVEQVGGEVILADSLSNDRTIEIARRFPVTVVQLRNCEDRRCGAGPQLGYQAATGEYVYILDGDMELDPEFLPLALEEMAREPRLAGVAGLVEEQSAVSYQFRGNVRRSRKAAAAEIPWLDGGGLYRRSALQEVGYCSNRNLHAFEEMELGIRLRHAGWRLRRISARSVLHHGYVESSWKLLMRRLRSRYLDGAGEILRASLGKPYFKDVAMRQKHLLTGLALWIGAVVGLLSLPFTPWVLIVTAAATAVLVLLRAVRTRSLEDALFGQLVWQLTALAMVRGFLARPVDPERPIESVTVASSDAARV